MTRRSKMCKECSTKRQDPGQHPDPTKRYVPLTRNKIATVDAADYERVKDILWAARKSYSTKIERFYAVHSFCIDGEWKQIQMHRFILGVTDPKIQVDHKKPKETLNNTRENLRLSTPSQNQANRETIRSISGYKGVAWVGRRKGRSKGEGWRGEVVLDGKRTVGPIVQDPKEAARWYDVKALELFGEFARINFPSGS